MGAPLLGLAALDDSPRRVDAGTPQIDRRVDLEHPASHAEADVVRIWFAYLARRGRAHAFYLSYNTIIAPLALALLWPLPGPNLIGYWFAYRAVHHWLILRGIQAVRKGRIATHYHANARLDQPVNRDPDGKACHAAVNGNGDRLDDYLNFAQCFERGQE